jgi:hypothetical protein
MEISSIDREFVESLTTRQLHNYFEKLVHEYNHLVQHRKGLKDKYFIIVQRNIADTFTWDDYHQRIKDYQIEDADFAQRVDWKNQQLEFVSSSLRQRINNERKSRNNHH